MEQNREPRNKPLHIWSNDLPQGHQDDSMGKRWCLQHMVVGKLDIHIQKNPTGTFLTLYKKRSSKQFKNVKVIIKLLEKNPEKHVYDIAFENDFLDMTTKVWKQKQKQTNVTMLNFKTFVHQRTRSTESKGCSCSGRKYMCLVFFHEMTSQIQPQKGTQERSRKTKFIILTGPRDVGTPCHAE